MTPQTALVPTPTLPAVITSPPIARFALDPQCIDPIHTVVVTSCGVYPSPDWLTCAVTNLPSNVPASCFEGQTSADAETSGCPSGFTGASTLRYGRTDGLESFFFVHCCPTQYRFDANRGFVDLTTARDGITYSYGYPVPECAASYISDLVSSPIIVQTSINTVAWEKRQLEPVETVTWDYEHDTMYANAESYSYTVFDHTHTCYQDCTAWESYYVSGGPAPSTTIDTAPDTTTPVEEPPSTEETGVPSTTVDTPPEATTPVEEPSSTEETSAPSTPPVDAQTTSSLTGEDSVPVSSSIEQTPAPAPSGSYGNTTTSSPSPSSSAISDVPTGAGAAVTPTRLVLLGLFASLIAL
ncbi:hypothetical protein F5X98DRAFT_334170 [Xylaria grammica]|nr:hypothetical protein F5X98DRAFT_334170 [Xylaria grammica]